MLVDDGTNGYLHAGGLVSQIDGSNAATYPLTDALGSVRGLTDGAGTVTGSRDYEVFGTPRNQSGASSRFGFTGEPTDATTGDVYLRSRHYNPSTGRFLSADTVQPNAPGTQGYNRYAYVANNPMRYADPTGHTINDAEQGLEILAGLTTALVAVGAAIQAALPLLLMPFVGFALGLMFFILILTIVALMFQVIGEILDLLVDEFDHYLGDRPVDDCGGCFASGGPSGLPEEPEDECPINGGAIELVASIVGGMDATGLAGCLDRIEEGINSGDLSLEDLQRLIDLLAILDLVPIAELCYAGAASIPPLLPSALVAYAACDQAEQYIGIAAFLASLIGIAISECSDSVKASAVTVAVGSLAADSSIVPPILDEVADYAAYLGSAELLTC